MLTIFTVINVLQACLLDPTFIHNDFARKPVGANGVFEKGGNHPFISTFGKHEINGVAKFVRKPSTRHKDPILDLGVFSLGVCFSFVLVRWKLVHFSLKRLEKFNFNIH